MPDGTVAERRTRRQEDGCATLGRRVEAAWGLAEAGRHRDAGDLCAAICLQDLQALRGAPVPTARFVEALLLSRMFVLLARVVRALHGVEVSIVPMAGNGTGDAYLSVSDGCKVVVALDPAALGGADGARVARAWGRRILDDAERRAAWPAGPSCRPDAQPHRLEAVNELAAQQLGVV